MEAQIILSKCPKSNKLYGMRVEKRNDDWVRTWAFPLSESQASHEGYNKNVISGSLDAVDNYPGCPYCEAFGFVVHGINCGKMSCYHGEESMKCEWCGEIMLGISEVSSFEVSGEGF